MELGGALKGRRVARQRARMGSAVSLVNADQMGERVIRPFPTVAPNQGNGTSGRLWVETATLSVRGVSVQFGGVYALRDVSLDCGQGEIVGLIGPNGAGKTTLLNVISGTQVPQHGDVQLGEVALTGCSPQFCARAGVARTFQNIRLFAGLTVRQNIEVAHTTALRHRTDDVRGMAPDELLAELGLDAVADRKAGTLPYGFQRRLEVARALALAPRIVLLDEPAAGMNDAESASLIELFREIRDRSGAGLLIIDHDMRFIMNVCERLYVLAKGEMIAHGTPKAIQANPDVIDVYLGAHRGDPIKSVGGEADITPNP